MAIAVTSWIVGSRASLLGLIWLATACEQPTTVDRVQRAYEAAAELPPLTFITPLPGAIFPQEIPAPEFRWRDESRADRWLVLLRLAEKRETQRWLVRAPGWQPSREIWTEVKRRCVEQPAELTVIGFGPAPAVELQSASSARFSTAADPVGAPLFYRDVPLPFIDAVKRPDRIRWRFGSVASELPPPVVLEGLPVCGNCHSFSADGSVLGMDVDYGNDKGSYVIAPVRPEILLAREAIITWSDLEREAANPTFGLLSQVSPSGRWVVSTVKDRSVFVPKPDLEYSQLFFPIRGILGVYDRQTGRFFALPGADDPAFVQSNPVWSPDEKYLVFARAEAHQLQDVGDIDSVLLSPDEAGEFLRQGKLFRFDLYRIPFNGGRGGVAEPLEGAAANGRSNFFPRYSPNGEWIVFCRANSFMLLQPDSEMFVIPAAGGTPRRLGCNTARMNSWHSFSPNGRWLAFASKQLGPYTQLFVAHFNGRGECAPPVPLSRFSVPERAINIPEFVNVEPGAITRLVERFVDDLSHLRAGWELERVNDQTGAVRAYQKGLAYNPENADLHYRLGVIRFGQGNLAEAGEQFDRAVSLRPSFAGARANLGAVLLQQGRAEVAEKHLREALRLDPQYAYAHLNYGTLLARRGEVERALGHFEAAVRADPDNVQALLNLAEALREVGRQEEATQALQRVQKLRSGR